MAEQQTVSVVIPVYRGAGTLERVVTEVLEVLGAAVPEGGGDSLRLEEVVLVHDGAVDASAEVMEKLAAADPRVKPVWLSRNYGQHAATLAGCASTVGDWIVTIDEDGLFDPAAVPDMHAAAVADGADLVYGHPQAHTHASWRVATSKGAKRLAELFLGVPDAPSFASFRLVEGYTMRALAAYCGYGVYLDVALSWVINRSIVVRTEYRKELRDTPSGYSFRSLLSHFRRMAMTAGTRPLRLAAAFGLLTTAVGVIGAMTLVMLRLLGAIEVPGWTSVMVVMVVFLGAVLVVLGAIAEYLSAALAAVSGRPPYLITGRPPRRVGDG